MRVFVTGATGFIGSAIVQELLGAGHQVTGLARSEASAKALMAAGAQVHEGSLEDLDSLRRGAVQAEGAIHTAYFHGFGQPRLSTRLRIMFGGSPSGIATRFMAASLEADRRAIETIGQALKGPDRALVAAFGTMALTAGRLATEEDAPDPRSAGGPRGQSEKVMLALAASGVRASIVRLAPTVHGDGDHGFVPSLIGVARKKGFSAYIGDGRNRWPTVHRLDAARLFRLALEKGSAGSVFHGVDEEGVPMRDIAQVIGQRLNVPVMSKSPEEGAKLWSWLARFLPVDNPTSSALTRERLAWRPTQPGLISDLEQAHYFKQTV